MDQNVGAVHGDNHAFHNELRRSLVHLVSFQPGNEKPFSVAAIPIVSVNGFCYMISHSKVFRQQDAANWQHRVIFPDEIIVMLRIEDVIIQGSLAAFSVNTTAELPNPVKFSEQQVSHNQEVHTVNFEGVMEPSLLVRGRVTHYLRLCSIWRQQTKEIEMHFSSW
ncbi:Os07g0666200 [Oryza sativa Japonica Group]|uniref:Os07g0666200 protein n=1 Tax=Oryza sativa subsp. japonica TaxID=39947 RepID=Q0D3U0_ORYSJ|nr:Os07g0666200 [Oryza sativa Japonica Group]|eukprot:NP_001060569.2 Os07g0666200 [Oryza sativa Japonica Group]